VGADHLELVIQCHASPWNTTGTGYSHASTSALAAELVFLSPEWIQNTAGERRVKFLFGLPLRRIRPRELTEQFLRGTLGA
jgi:hypothetical protein